MESEIRELKHYLTRYFRAMQNMAILEERLSAVRKKLRGNTEPAERVEKQLRLQELDAAAAMEEIVEMTALLPADSYERVILELRHIDCKSWTGIQRAVHLSASPCYAYYKKGLEALLEIPGVRARIGLDSMDCTKKPGNPGP